MDYNSTHTLEDGFVFISLDNAYCNNNGWYYEIEIQNLTRSICRCQPSYYGEKCDQKDESNLIIVVYGLLGVNGLLLLLILTVFTRAYFKWRNVCHLRSIAVKRIRNEILACNELKSNIRRNQISFFQPRNNFNIRDYRKNIIQRKRSSSETFSFKTDFTFEGYVRGNCGDRNHKFVQRTRSKSIEHNLMFKKLY
ncbi:uncharacterized protein LOC136079958 [Hydra vulgaris]|uniref:Uncharacterized protein LOC136079958 n=1 Tax=Hydra vulgaris TaxID=6087 RepID=A0ABM4BU43_HYDVU